jgi:pimeloyl-ACP methyl ester carboxylesterase
MFVMAGDEVPETRFASLGEDRIAYQVFGEGDIDLLYASATGDPVDLRWDWPPYASFLRRLGRQARVIMFDRRGSGSSDSASGETLPGRERWADEARAVLDAVASQRVVLFGWADSGPLAILFAASHPTRTRGLILANTCRMVRRRARVSPGHCALGRKSDRGVRGARLGDTRAGRVHNARRGS